MQGQIPEPRDDLTPVEQAAYSVAKASILGDSTVQSGTPFVGAMDIALATKLITNALSGKVDFSNPHHVLQLYSVPNGQVIDAAVEEPAPPVEPTVEPESPDDDVSQSITGLLEAVKLEPTIPLAVVGDAGTGKTSIIRQWAEDNGYELNLFLANTASEDDVAGAIAPDHEKRMAVSYPLEKLHRSTTHKTLLFLDELNTARREIQDPLLTLIQDRCLPNGTPLHPDTIIVTAINPSATYNNHEMSPQLRNRFMWHYHTPNEADWAVWVKTTELGDSPAGRHLTSMVHDGTLKFDKDEVFAEERNEFTTPRSVYNLLKLSGGSINRLKALADNLLAPHSAEAVRLHGYTDRDSRANSFFDERAKEKVVEEDPLVSGAVDADQSSSSLTDEIRKRLEEQDGGN